MKTSIILACLMAVVVFATAVLAAPETTGEDMHAGHPPGPPPSGDHPPPPPNGVPPPNGSPPPPRQTRETHDGPPQGHPTGGPKPHDVKNIKTEN